jgi:hypothetical protein
VDYVHAHFSVKNKIYFSNSLGEIILRKKKFKRLIYSKNWRYFWKRCHYCLWILASLERSQRNGIFSNYRPPLENCTKVSSHRHAGVEYNKDMFSVGVKSREI